MERNQKQAPGLLAFIAPLIITLFVMVGLLGARFMNPIIVWRLRIFADAFI